MWQAFILAFVIVGLVAGLVTMIIYYFQPACQLEVSEIKQGEDYFPGQKLSLFTPGANEYYSVPLNDSAPQGLSGSNKIQRLGPRDNNVQQVVLENLTDGFLVDSVTVTHDGQTWEYFAVAYTEGDNFLTFTVGGTKQEDGSIEWSMGDFMDFYDASGDPAIEETISLSKCVFPCGENGLVVVYSATGNSQVRYFERVGGVWGGAQTIYTVPGSFFSAVAVDTDTDSGDILVVMNDWVSQELVYAWKDPLGVWTTGLVAAPTVFARDLMLSIDGAVAIVYCNNVTVLPADAFQTWVTPFPGPIAWAAGPTADAALTNTTGYAAGVIHEGSLIVYACAVNDLPDPIIRIFTRNTINLAVVQQVDVVVPTVTTAAPTLVPTSLILTEDQVVVSFGMFFDSNPNDNEHYATGFIYTSFPDVILEQEVVLSSSANVKADPIDADPPRMTNHMATGTSGKTLATITTNFANIGLGEFTTRSSAALDMGPSLSWGFASVASVKA